MSHRIHAYLVVRRKRGVLGHAAFYAETRPTLFVLREASGGRPDARDQLRAIRLHFLSHPGSGVHLRGMHSALLPVPLQKQA